MNADLTLGEYLRRLRRAKRWQLQELASAAGLSVTHVSRIENDNTIPNPDTVVKLANALDGDLDLMLQLANCLPREILERLARRAEDKGAALHRNAGLFTPVGDTTVDPGFARALVEELDPHLLSILAVGFGLAEADVPGIFHVLRRLAQMEPAERESVLKFLLPSNQDLP